MDSILVPILLKFLNTLGFPIFIRGVDYLILINLKEYPLCIPPWLQLLDTSEGVNPSFLFIYQSHRFDLCINNRSTSFRNSRYTFLYLRGLARCCPRLYVRSFTVSKQSLAHTLDKVQCVLIGHNVYPPYL